MSYSEAFKKALEFTLKFEGGYSNHPMDKGGPTMKGITQAVYDQYCKSKGISNTPVKTIKDSEVEEIYYNSYWLPAKCYNYPIKLAIAVFDFAVNSGVKRALNYLAVCNSDLNAYIDQREQFFRTIGVGPQKVFLKGWLARIVGLKSYLSILKE